MAELIEMPKLSDTMTVGTLIKWLVKEGDEVSSGDMLCEVETDKATMEVENFFDGVILKAYVSEGSEVPLGTPICAIGEKDEEAPDVSLPSADEVEAQKEESGGDEAKDLADRGGESEAKPESEPVGRKQESLQHPAPGEPEPIGDSTASSRTETGRIKASPLARKIAEEKGLDLATVAGSGPHGRIVKRDVLAAAERRAEEPAAAPSTGPAMPAGAPIATDEAIKVSNMRKTIAKRLVESKTQYPHFYLNIEVDAAPLAALRKQLNEQLAELPSEQGGIKFSVNELVLKASAEALRRVPAINASWNGDSIQQHGAVHLAFGVAIDDGLITPVIRDAHAKTLRQIAIEGKELVKKARGKKLKPEEMTGSTFTVTNLGMFGINEFYGIINPPNAAILSVGATVKKPVVGGNDEIVVGQRMNVGLSGDHRVVDGATGAMYLQALKEILESPAVMLV